ncbi:MAG: NlpC/P60 family protein [Syntrophotaleaceae bacterium]
MSRKFLLVIAFTLWATTAFAEPGAGDQAYTLQVGAFALETAAEKIACKLEDTGLNPFVTPNKKGLFVVRLGNFVSRDQARQTAARLKAEGVVKSSLIVKTTLPTPEVPAESQTSGQPIESADVVGEVPPAAEEAVPQTVEPAAIEAAIAVPAEPEMTVRAMVASELKDLARHPLGPQNLGFRAARIALDFLGVKYRLGGMSRETGMDCSGFVKTVYSLCGINLPRTSSEQYHQGKPIERTELAAGDLVFFGKNQRVNHVGIYLGEGKYIHAPRPKETIRISNLEEKSTLRRFLGARRLLSDD